MKMIKTKLDPEVFYYNNKKGEKLFAYRHRFYDALGNRKEKSKQGFKFEKEAYRELLKVKSDVLNGKSNKVINANLTVQEWMQIWHEANKSGWEISTDLQRADIIRIHINELIGKYKLSELDKNTYKIKFIDSLLKKYAPSTVRNIHNIFKIAINAAVDDEILERNRFNKISIPDDTVNENFFTPAELSEFLKITQAEETPTNFMLFFILAYTGLRKGEAFGMKWKDIDFESAKLKVNCTRDNYGERSPKTKNSYRTVTIEAVVTEHLQKYKKWCKRVRLANGLPFNDDLYVFISPKHARETCVNIINHSMSRIIERHNLKYVTPHGLRHTHATILIKQRIPVTTIAERLGNTPAMIYKIYGHNLEELEREASSAFGDALNVI